MLTIAISGTTDPGIFSKHLVLKSIFSAVGIDSQSDLRLIDSKDVSASQSDIIIDFNRGTLPFRNKLSPPTVFCMHGSVARNDDNLAQLYKVIRPCDRLWVTSCRDAAVLGARVPLLRDQIATIPLAVEHQIFSQWARSYAANCEIKIGFLGRLMPQKGLVDAVKISSSVAKRLNTSVSLILFGEYSDYPDLGLSANEEFKQSLARSIAQAPENLQIEFKGFIADRYQFASQLASLSVVLHPTRLLDENFGLAPVEAMTCGVPVISSDWGGLADTVPFQNRIPTFATLSGPRYHLSEFTELLCALVSSSGKLKEASEIAQQAAACFKVHDLQIALMRVFDEMLQDKRRDCYEIETASFLAPLSRGDVDVDFSILGLKERWQKALPAIALYGTGRSADLTLLSDNDMAVSDAHGNVYFDDDGWPASLKLRGGAVGIAHNFDGLTIEDKADLGLVLPRCASPF